MSYGFLAPPAVFVVLALIGTCLALYHAPLGLLIALLANLCLFALALPAVANYLLQRVEDRIPPAAGTDLGGAQAIVVLGGDMRRGHGEDKDTLGPYANERIVMAAAAYRKLNLPVAVTGGHVDQSRASEAGLMRDALDTEFSIPVTWTEDRSATTWENAVFTQRLLQPAGIRTVVLVTQAWHMPRAIWAFDRVGLHAVPWPAPRDRWRPEGLGDFLPDSLSLRDSFLAFHELLGSLYYRLHY